MKTGRKKREERVNQAKQADIPQRSEDEADTKALEHTRDEIALDRLGHALTGVSWFACSMGYH